MAAQQLTVGAPATVQIPGIAEPVPAHVSLVSPALDPGSTTVEVWLRVDNRHGTFKAGTAVHVKITGRSAHDALTIPLEAVQTASDGVTKSVMVVASDGAAHKHPVKLGMQSSDKAQILDGLSRNDLVITTGAYALDDGTKVKIGTDPSAPNEGSTTGKKGDQ